MWFLSFLRLAWSWILHVYVIQQLLDLNVISINSAALLASHEFSAPLELWSNIRLRRLQRHTLRQGLRRSWCYRQIWALGNSGSPQYYPWWDDLWSISKWKICSAEAKAWSWETFHVSVVSGSWSITGGLLPQVLGWATVWLWQRPQNLSQQNPLAIRMSRMQSSWVDLDSCSFCFIKCFCFWFLCAHNASIIYC